MRSEYAKVQTGFESTRDTTGRVLAQRIEGARSALFEAADGLESIEPPEEVEHENEELVEAMREYAEQLESLVEAAEEGRQAAIDEYNEGLAESEVVEEIAEAAEEMKFKGYDLGRIAEE